MLRLAFDFIITWRETRTRPNAYIVSDSFPIVILTFQLAYYYHLLSYSFANNGIQPELSNIKRKKMKFNLIILTIYSHITYKPGQLIYSVNKVISLYK